MFVVGKLVQALALGNVGYALVVGLTDERGMARELGWMSLGLLVFYVGRLLERRSAAGE